MTYRNVLHRSSVSFLFAAMLMTACGGESPEKLIGSAKEYLAKNDPKAAAIQIKNALQKNPEIPEGRYLLGKALLESGEPIAAEVELRKALDQKFPEDKVIPLLARAVSAQGQAKKVIDEFSRTELSVAESKADLDTSVAMAHAALGDIKAAEDALGRALQAVPDYAPALTGQARLKATTKDLPGAEALIDTVLAKNPQLHDAWKLKGDLRLAAGMVDEGLEAYGKAIAIKPDFLPAYIASISVMLSSDKLEAAGKQLDSLKKVAPKHPQVVYLSTRYALVKKDYAKARESSQQLLKVMPNNPASLSLAGAIELHFKALVQAETYLVQSLQLAPEQLDTRRLLAEVYLLGGQYAKARTTLAPALEKAVADPALLTLAAEIALQSGDAKLAESYLTRAIALDPKDSRKRTTLALAHLAQGGGDAALAELTQIAASDSTTTADLALITSLLQRSRYDEALKAIDVLDKKIPDSPTVPNLRGQTYLVKKDLPNARANFERALGLNPTFFPAAASLAKLDLDAQKIDDARKRFEGILAKDPKNVQAMLALAELRLRNGDTPQSVADQVSKAVAASPTEVPPRLALIDLYLRAKDYTKALSVAQDGVAALPSNPELVDALARAQLASGDTNQAVITLNKLSGMMPGSPVPYIRLADVQMASKNTEAATQSLIRALELNPDQVEAQRRLVGIYLAGGKTADAVNVAKSVQKRRPQSADGFVLEGDIAASRKAWSDAVGVYRQGLKASQAPQLVVKLHGALVASGNKAEADKTASSWLQDHPKDSVFRFYLAEYASAQRDYASAAKQYQALLQIQPENALALNNLAWVSGQLKDPKAIEYAERANSLASNQPAMMDTLAMLLAESGNTDRALQLLNRALSIAPQAADIRLNLARVLIQVGKKSDAKAALDEIAKLGTSYPRQTEVEELRKAL